MAIAQMCHHLNSHKTQTIWENNKIEDYKTDVGKYDSSVPRTFT